MRSAPALRCCWLRQPTRHTKTAGSSLPAALTSRSTTGPAKPSSRGQAPLIAEFTKLPDNAQPSAAEMIEAAQGILAKGRQVIPLPGAGEKGIHPPGLTGYLGQPATMAQLRKWIEHGFKAYEQSP